MYSLRRTVLALTAAMSLFTGCRYKSAPTPTVSTPAASMPTAPTPLVIFIGDSITYLWATGPGQACFGIHPTWIAKGVPGQTSGQVLARFQTDVIDLHPAVVHILVGTNDVYPGWTLGPSDANVTAMAQMAQVFAIKVVLATIPPWETDPLTGDVAYGADPSPSRYERIEVWNDWLRPRTYRNEMRIGGKRNLHSVTPVKKTMRTASTVAVHTLNTGECVMPQLMTARAIETTRLTDAELRKAFREATVVLMQLAVKHLLNGNEDAKLRTLDVALICSRKSIRRKPSGRKPGQLLTRSASTMTGSK
jgi:hypothetical protein